MSKAFLSHSSSDKELVRKVAKQLGVNNCTLDEISFEPGRKTLDEIFFELEKTDLFVLFISDKSLSSAWVKKEIIKAKEHLSNDIIERILPIIIDRDIKYSDPRIPKWIAKPYNLKFIDNEVIILKKIRQGLREINFKKNRFNEEIEKNFVGRNEQMERFENDINNLDNWVPTCIIAYNFFEGIGRRTFLKNALRKTLLIDSIYDPVYISIDSKESIENFIYKLNTIGKINEVSQYDFSEESVDSKIEIAKKIVKQFISFNEKIFIIDDGGIILPNTQMVEWFERLINDEEFSNQLSICLISKYRPNEVRLRKYKKSLVFRIPELSKVDSKNLFLKLLNIHGLSDINREDKEFFINNLKGIPSQIIYAVNQIDINLLEAKKNINDIVEYSDTFTSTILNQVKQNELSYQILILLSKSEIFSIDLINKIFGETSQTSEAIQTLYDLSVFNFVFSSYEYVRLNSYISDYINRSKLSLTQEYQSRFDNILKDLLRQDLDVVLENDYTEFIITIQKMLEEEKKIPKKYFIPALIIKNIIKEYDKGNYDYVIKICLQLLQNTNYDEQIIWETKYRLTLAYARNKDENFFEHVNYFKNEKNSLDYYFLLGFYYRIVNNKEKALEYFYKALSVYSEHSISKREIVNIYLSKGQYREALSLAKENYEKKRTNIFHLHSYFVCLVRQNVKFSNRDIQIIHGLMDAVRNSLDIKAEDIYRCMEGEYEFYVNNDLPKAIEILKNAIKLNENKLFPKKSLLEIYRKRDMSDAYDKLLATNLNGNYEEEN
ncbi:TIR domain-containing protein [Flavobacterium rakeshii]|uniref:TIR domain-containing protein n=1 Tax=Flavobacterium rakeshii TaxID=1038845 RepID=A0A6N8HDP9_9FLAO|nr:toll/interleukin-1 receptor domain-containing protein [Flavobacterium rakeshii]MUV03885.1 TIR domain-containing protein [Flavobacterium rakeshii]